MKKLLTGIIIIFATSSAHDIDGGRNFGLSGAILLSEVSATEFVSCPAGPMSAGRITVESGYLRRYDLSDLDQYFIAAAAKYKRFQFGVEVSQFGKSDYYTEKILRLTLSYGIDSLSIGIIAGGKLVEFGNVDESYNSIGLGLAAGYHWSRYHVAAVADNINKPRLSSGSEPDYRNVSFYAEIEGPQYYSIVGRLYWEDYSPVRATLGQIFHVTDDHRLMWGISSNPLSYSGGVELGFKRYYIGYAVANHPTLGLSHGIVLGVRNLK